MICALVFVALVGPGHAAEAIVGANAAIQGEGRFYNATEELLSGFFSRGHQRDQSTRRPHRQCRQHINTKQSLYYVGLQFQQFLVRDRIDRRIGWGHFGEIGLPIRKKLLLA